MLRGVHPVLQALLASLFTWAVTALGAAAVFILPPRSKKLLDVSLGFAAGVMMAASFWSLLAPAIEIAQRTVGSLAFLPVAFGFGLGASFVHFADRLMPSCILSDSPVIDLLRRGPCGTGVGIGLADDDGGCSTDDLELKSRDATANGLVARAPRGRRPAPSPDTATPGDADSGAALLVPGRSSAIVAVTSTKDDLDLARPALPPSTVIHRDMTDVSWRRILLLIVAVTVHNIPEGLAVGVGFGSIGASDAATFESASNLAFGIALQNFPEGLAVSLPLAGFGHSRLRAFAYGQLSGMVEPVFAVLGAAAVLLMRPVLPYALSFAAGAMIYVVVDDIVPEAQRNDNGKAASVGTIVGFLVMMCLDVGLG